MCRQTHMALRAGGPEVPSAGAATLPLGGRRASIRHSPLPVLLYGLGTSLAPNPDSRRWLHLPGPVRQMPRRNRKPELFRLCLDHRGRGQRIADIASFASLQTPAGIKVTFTGTPSTGDRYCVIVSGATCRSSGPRPCRWIGATPAPWWRILPRLKLSAHRRGKTLLRSICSFLPGSDALTAARTPSNFRWV